MSEPIIEKYDPIHHIGMYQIPDDVCDGLMDFYDTSPNQKSGQASNADIEVAKSAKKSTDVTVRKNELEDSRIKAYTDLLGDMMQDYMKMFPSIGTGSWMLGINEDFNIQRYQPGEGFFDWHYERNPFPPNSARVLVFMTYLNDAEGAGTHFMYQNLTTECKKGVTVLWPADWTYTHKGQISKEHEKTIITGWISYTGEVNELPRDNTDNK